MTDRSDPDLDPRSAPRADLRSDPRTDQRLTELEIKASFADDLLDQLNAVVARQQQHIDRLQRELDDLRRLVGDGAPPAVRSLREELPPHY
jgi:SlyX protein